MSTIRKFLNKFYYLKLCYSRAYAYFGIFLQLAQYFLLVGVWLKMYMPTVRLWMVASVFVLVVLFAVSIGHWDIVNKLAHDETRINNSINPELMSIYNRTVEEKK